MGLIVDVQLQTNRLYTRTSNAEPFNNEVTTDNSRIYQPKQQFNLWINPVALTLPGVPYRCFWSGGNCYAKFLFNVIRSYNNKTVENKFSIKYRTNTILLC